MQSPNNSHKPGKAKSLWIYRREHSPQRHNKTTQTNAIVHEKKAKTSSSASLALQTSLALQSTTNSRYLLNNVADLQSALANFQNQFLAALEADGHDGGLCGGAWELVHLDVDVSGATCDGVGGAQEGEEEAAWSGGLREWVEGCAEGGDGAEWDGHGCGCGGPAEGR